MDEEGEWEKRSKGLSSQQLQRSDDQAEVLGAGECYHVLNGVYQNHTDCEDVRDIRDLGETDGDQEAEA